MENPVNNIKRPVDRRSFMKSGLLAGGAAAVGAGLLANGTLARAQERGSLNAGDAAILRFLAAAELIESDLWIQYAELGGIGKTSPSRWTRTRTPLNHYQIALSNLDGDGPQYITSNTLDEMSHASFPQRLSRVQRRRAGQLRRVPNFAGKHGHRDHRASSASPISCISTSTPVGSFATAAQPIRTSAPPFPRRSH